MKAIATVFLSISLVYILSCHNKKICNEYVCQKPPHFYYFYKSKDTTNKPFSIQLSFIGDSYFDSIINLKYKKYWSHFHGLLCQNYAPVKGENFPFLLIFRNNSDFHVLVYQNISCNDECWGKYRSHFFEFIKPHERILTENLYRYVKSDGDTLIDYNSCYFKLDPQECVMVLAYISQIQNTLYQKKDNNYTEYTDSLEGKWCYRIETDYVYYNKDEKLKQILTKTKKSIYSDTICFNIDELNNNISINPLSEYENECFIKWMKKKK